jgi:hypothetical protein
MWSQIARAVDAFDDTDRLALVNQWQHQQALVAVGDQHLALSKVDGGIVEIGDVEALTLDDPSRRGVVAQRVARPRLPRGITGRVLPQGHDVAGLAIVFGDHRPGAVRGLDQLLTDEGQQLLEIESREHGLRDAGQGAELREAMEDIIERVRLGSGGAETFEVGLAVATVTPCCAARLDHTLGRPLAQSVRGHAEQIRRLGDRQPLVPGGSAAPCLVASRHESIIVRKLRLLESCRKLRSPGGGFPGQQPTRARSGG